MAKNVTILCFFDIFDCLCLLQSFLTIFIEIKGKEDFHDKSNKYEKALKEADAKEKQVTLPSGHVINYGEVENDKPALLLIHGQMGMWVTPLSCLS